MRLRQAVWPVVVILVPMLVGSWALDVAQDPRSSAEVAFDAFLFVLTMFVIMAVSFRRVDVRLRPDGLQRGFQRQPYLVPWERIQAVALAGDSAGVCPTLWTDDGREIYLDELAKTGGLGARKVRRNCERIRAHWETHRGPSWQPAPWAAGIVPSWVAGSARQPDAVTPAAITARLKPAWYVCTAYGVLTVLPLATAPLRLAWWDGWSWSTELFIAVMTGLAVFALIRGAGARVSAYGIARGGGARTRVAWSRIQAVTITGGRWFARPTVWADDGRAVKLHDLGVVFGLGRKRAERMLHRIGQTWLAERGPGWRPLPPHVPAPPFPVRPDVNYWAPPAI